MNRDIYYMSVLSPTHEYVPGEHWDLMSHYKYMRTARSRFTLTLL